MKEEIEFEIPFGDLRVPSDIVQKRPNIRPGDIHNDLPTTDLQIVPSSKGDIVPPSPLPNDAYNEWINPCKQPKIWA